MIDGKHKAAARLVTAVAVAGVGAAGVLSAGAGAADAAKLPGGFKSRSVPGGKVTIRLFDESFRITNSVANNHFSREVFVSGKVKVTTSGDIEGGTVTAGYLVGCQLNFGAESEGSAEQPFDSEGTGDAEAGVDAGFTLSPGEAKFVPVVNVVDDEDEEIDAFDFSDARGGVAYSAERFGVDGCAGFAQARALVNVQVETDGKKSNVTLYGRPFSIG
ncbi:MAG: MspA family porin [Gordonia sp. (in: high G+C Gram-positive bacteria)]|uniref:MspA family porin n=1 Tax=Gordonia sp. (in: high G+C Gram-positive bacteria) TaxID=84139 RepID=UPI0039E6E3EF